MSIPLFILEIWLANICAVAAIFLCGVFGMAIYKAGKWTLRRLHEVTYSLVAADSQTA